MLAVTLPSFSQNIFKLDGFLATALVELVPDPSPEKVTAHRNLVRDVKDVPVVLAAASAIRLRDRPTTRPPD